MAKSDIEIKVTADTKDAEKGLKGLDDAAGKTGAGMSGLGKAGLAAGAAVVALGVKSIMAFEDLGLSVGKFADATGVTEEEASKLVEVAGDVGVSADALSGAFGIMEKNLGKNAKLFANLGIEVAKTADGQTDANETFLNAADALSKIEDPAKRAEAGAKIFGKGWQNMAELINQGGPQLRANLSAVSDSKIFDKKKVAEARELRESFEKITDAGEDLLLIIGKTLVPIISKLAKTFGEVLESVGPLAEEIGNTLAAALKAIGPILEVVVKGLALLAKGIAAVLSAITEESVVDFTDQIADMGKQAIKAGMSQEELTKVMRENGGVTKATAAALKAYVDDINATAEANRVAADRQEHLGLTMSSAAVEVVELKDSYMRLSPEVQAYNDRIAASKTATDELNTAYATLMGTLDQKQAWRDVKSALDEAFIAMGDLNLSTDQQAEKLENAQGKLATFVNNLKGIPAETKASIITDISQADVAALANIARLVAAIGAYQKTTISSVGKPSAAGGDVGVFADGGVVGGPIGAPQLAVVHGGETVLPTHKTGVSMGGQTVIINAGLDERRVTALLRRNARRGGRNPWG